METIWVKPFDHFSKKDAGIVQHEVTDWRKEVGCIFLLAVDKADNIVVGLRLKSWKK